MSYRAIKGPHTGLIGDLIYESAYSAVLKIDTGDEIAVMKDWLEEVNDYARSEPTNQFDNVYKLLYDKLGEKLTAAELNTLYKDIVQLFIGD